MRIGAPGAETPVVEIEGVRYDASQLGDFGPSFWDGGPARLAELVSAGELPRLEGSDDRFGAPVVSPSAVVCIGQNYAAHAAESGAEPPKRPIIFLKTPNTVAGPNDDVTIPKNSQRTDWEVELAIVIGSPAAYCPSREEAATHIAGYTVANDLSEREWQIEHSAGQWSKGKCVKGYLPLGPVVVTPDEFDPRDVGLRSSVNGEPRQDSRTSDMIFDCAEIVRDLSQYLQLEPGDVICTGTPQGVALSGRFPYLGDGDVVEVEIDGLGSQRQTYRRGEN